jgi:hypothetical protein
VSPRGARAGVGHAHGLDIPALADDVIEGRRALENVIDQIVVATPDDRDRRRAVGELQQLILGRARRDGRPGGNP